MFYPRVDKLEFFFVPGHMFLAGPYTLNSLKSLHFQYKILVGRHPAEGDTNNCQMEVRAYDLAEQKDFEPKREKEISKCSRND